MLKTFVLISEVSNLSDARYCAGMGVNVLGFVADNDALSYVSPEKFKEIKAWVAGVSLFVETQSHDIASVLALLNQYEADGLIISSLDLVNALKENNITFILRVSQDDLLSGSLKNYLDENDMLAIETSDLPSTELLSASEDFSVLLHSSLNTEETLDLLEQNILFGIELKGGQEERPGFKDFDDLMEILEALELE